MRPLRRRECYCADCGRVFANQSSYDRHRTWRGCHNAARMRRTITIATGGRMYRNDRVDGVTVWRLADPEPEAGPVTQQELPL